MQLAALLVAIYGAKLSQPHGQVAIRARLASVDFAVVGAVHRLEHILLALIGGMYGLEGILAILCVVSAGDIELLVADMRSDNLLITKLTLNLLKECLEPQAEVSALRQPDRQTLAYPLAEHKEFHLLAYLAMVALLGFLEHHHVLVEHLLLGE